MKSIEAQKPPASAAALPEFDRALFRSLVAVRTGKQAIGDAVRPLDPDGRRRVLAWLLYEDAVTQSEADRLATDAGASPRTMTRKDRKAERDGRPLLELGFACIAGVEAEPVDWLWTDWIPRGMLTLCDGRPDAGKTTLLCDLAARVTCGRTMPTEDFIPAGREPGSVIFVTSENAFAQVLRPRLEAAGADLSRCYGWAATLDEEGQPDCPRLPRDADLIGRATTEYGAALVIVDPLFSHMDGGLNPNRETDVRRALVPLARIAEETGAAVVAVRHFNKSANGDAINAGGGSIGIVGTARVQLVVGKPPETSDEDPARVVAVGKMNIASKPPSRAFSIVGAEVAGVASSRIDWGGVSTSTASDLTRARGGDTPATPARSEVEDWLRDELTGRERPALEMWKEAKAKGFARNTVYRAAEAAGVKKRQDGFHGPWLWSLPAPTDDAEGDGSLDPYSVVNRGDGGHLWENGGSKSLPGGERMPPRPRIPRLTTSQDMGRTGVSHVQTSIGDSPPPGLVDIESALELDAPFAS